MLTGWLHELKISCVLSTLKHINFDLIGIYIGTWNYYMTLTTRTIWFSPLWIIYSNEIYITQNMCPLIRRLLFNMYGNQKFQVRWNNCLSDMNKWPMEWNKELSYLPFYLLCILMDYFMNWSGLMLAVI